MFSSLLKLVSFFSISRLLCHSVFLPHFYTLNYNELFDFLTNLLRLSLSAIDEDFCCFSSKFLDAFIALWDVPSPEFVWFVLHLDDGFWASLLSNIQLRWLRIQPVIHRTSAESWALYASCFHAKFGWSIRLSLQYATLHFGSVCRVPYLQTSACVVSFMEYFVESMIVLGSIKDAYTTLYIPLYECNILTLLFSPVMLMIWIALCLTDTPNDFVSEWSGIKVISTFNSLVISFLTWSHLAGASVELWA